MAATFEGGRHANVTDNTDGRSEDVGGFSAANTEITRGSRPNDQLCSADLLDGLSARSSVQENVTGVCNKGERASTTGVPQAVIETDGSIEFEIPTSAHAKSQADIGKNESEPLLLEMEIGTYKNGSTIPPMEILEKGSSTIAFHEGARQVQNILRWAMHDFDSNKNGVLDSGELAVASRAANRHMHPFIASSLPSLSNTISTLASLSDDRDGGKAGISVDDIEQISNYDSYFKKGIWQTGNPHSWYYFLLNPSVGPSTKNSLRK